MIHFRLCDLLCQTISRNLYIELSPYPVHFEVQTGPEGAVPPSFWRDTILHSPSGRDLNGLDWTDGWTGGGPGVRERHFDAAPPSSPPSSEN